MRPGLHRLEGEKKGEKKKTILYIAPVPHLSEPIALQNKQQALKRIPWETARKNRKYENNHAADWFIKTIMPSRPLWMACYPPHIYMPQSFV